MKKYLLLILLAALTGCNKWLDIEPKGQILLTTVTEYGMLFDNIKTIDMADIAYLDDDMWRNAQNIISVWNTWDLTSANMLYLTQYNRSLNAAGNNGTAGTTLYQAMYQNIARTANTIIDAQSTMKGTEREIAGVVAEAKMLRAYMYFILINVYAKPYDKNLAATDGGVPIKLDAVLETVPVPAKSTVQQVYDQIEKDINEALPGLYDKAETPYRFNKAAGYALKAKVHLFKKEYDKCIQAAAASYALNSNTFNLATLVNATTNKPTTSLYADGAENLYFLTSSSSYIYIGQELINLYKRGLQQYGLPATVTDARLDLYKRPAATVGDYMYMVGWVPNTKEYSPNVAGLTTVEVMLMLAECYARGGNYAKVREFMTPYLKSRYRNYADAALELPNDVTTCTRFVLDERRKELTKGINRFFDLKRLNTETDYQKVPTRVFPADAKSFPNTAQATYTLPVKSPLYILPFPSKVLENDKRLASNTW